MKKNELLKHELVGLNANVVDSENKALVGMKGKIVDETRNMLTIDYDGKLKRLIKSQVILQLSYKGHAYEVNGKMLVNRPEDRIKKIRRLR